MHMLFCRPSVIYGCGSGKPLREADVKINVKKGAITEAATEAAVVIQFEGEAGLCGAALHLDEKCGGFISDIMNQGDFTGRLNQISVIYSPGGGTAKRLVVVGLGKRLDISLEKLRGAFSAAAQKIRSLNVREFSTTLDFGNIGLPTDRVAEAVVEGILLGLYRYRPFKTVDREEIREISEFTLLVGDGKAVKTIKDAASIAEIIAGAVLFARDIVSAPANAMTPTVLAASARASSRGRKIRCRVLGFGAMKKLGMNALLGVAAGSDEPPQFIIMEYRGGGKSAPFVALVGKGLTFDSGGISIKPAEKMDEMKSDMAGGAAVIAAVRAAAGLGL
ncbi:MAG: hypothetical protein FJ122_11710, partial [Deltaproteobacteria bacterium]|nr:hypothetical protein [Deltaproteobacteria bacterium]